MIEGFQQTFVMFESLLQILWTFGWSMSEL